jgi:hypothetical protein
MKDNKKMKRVETLFTQNGLRIAKRFSIFSEYIPELSIVYLSLLVPNLSNKVACYVLLLFGPQWSSFN